MIISLHEHSIVIKNYGHRLNLINRICDKHKACIIELESDKLAIATNSRSQLYDIIYRLTGEVSNIELQ